MSEVLPADLTGAAPGIVWLASYPRSGNTWLRFFLHSLFEIERGTPEAEIRLSGIGQHSNWECDVRNFEPFIPNAAAPERFADVNAARPFVQQAMLERAARTMFVKTHLVYAKVNGTPTINDNVTKAIVYLVRDPRDVACSLAAHKGMAVDAIIDQMENEQCVLPNGVGEIISSWSRNVESWTSPSRPSVLISRYEDMVADPATAFAAIVRHVGVQASDDIVARAVDLSSFGHLQQQETEFGFNPWSKDATGSFFRRGEAGAWRDELSGEQSARIEAAHRGQMLRFGYLATNTRR